jgi:DNA-binding response OmpR family regulator
MCQRLVQEGFVVESVDDVDALLAQVASGGVDLTLLEFSEPQRLALVPLLADTALVITMCASPMTAGEMVRVRALQMGADDVLAEHVGYVELLWRIQALLRRHGGRRHHVITVGELEVDIARREVRLRGRPIPLTPTELQLLVALAYEPDAVQSRERLLARVWRWPNPIWAPTRTLDLHASRLRKKLARDGDTFVVTVRGIGYRLLP